MTDVRTGDLYALLAAAAPTAELSLEYASRGTFETKELESLDEEGTGQLLLAATR